MKIRLHVFSYGIAMLVSQGTAMAVELRCPASINVSQAIIETPPTWTADNSQRTHELNGAGFTYGPVAQIGFIRPDENSKGKFRIVTYYFEGAQGSYWLNCNYERTSVTIEQPVSKEIKQCSVIYEVGRRGQSKFQSIKCK